MNQEVVKLINSLRLPSINDETYNKVCDKLCMIFYNSGFKGKAVEFLEKKRNLNFNDYKNIGNIYFELKNYSQSCQNFELSLSINYDIELAYKLATIYYQLNNIHLTYRIYKNILTINPNYVKALNNIAEIEMLIFRKSEALEHYQRAFKLDKRIVIYSNILMNSIYLENPNFSSIENFDSVTANFQKRSHIHAKSGNKINIGYISQEFLETDIKKPVNCFVKHLFDNHSDKFKVYCYHVHRNKIVIKDPTKLYTEDISNVTSRNLTGMKVSEIVDKIIEDKIDVLVELMNHTSGNVLEVLQCKPAPIQVSYCAFPGSTRSKMIDYKILDEFTNKGTEEYTEEIVCMPNGFHCYKATYDYPEKISIEEYEKQLKNREIVLCSFANPKKFNETLIETWKKIIENTKTKLYLRHSSYSSSFIRQSIKLMFEKHGISEQLVFGGFTGDYSESLKIYNQVDIFLDTFPYNGTTTVCEALLMGVPVITYNKTSSRAGSFLGDSKQSSESYSTDKVEGRVCGSLLKSCGLEEYICFSEDEYIEKVRSLLDKDVLVKERQRVNGVKTSYLFDDKRFIKDYETVICGLINNKD